MDLMTFTRPSDCLTARKLKEEKEKKVSVVSQKEKEKGSKSVEHV